MRRLVQHDVNATTRVLRVSAGVFVMRYAPGRSSGDTPEVRLTALPGSGVEIVSPDLSSEPVFRRANDAVVVRSGADSSVLVTILPSRSGGSRDAEFVFERVTLSSASVIDHVNPFDQPRSSDLPVMSPRILAHVSRRGDVMVDPGQWVCGPQLPMAVEGLQLIWPDRPADADIVLGCVVLSQGRRSVSPAPTGAFVGTRAQAAPIAGVTVALTGSGASHYRLRAEALFLGSPVQSREGSRLEFSGPTGFEPLVGFRLEVVRNDFALGAPPAPRHDSSSPLPVAFISNAESARGRERTPNEAGVSAEAGMRASQTGARSNRVRVFRAARSSPVVQQ